MQSERMDHRRLIRSIPPELRSSLVRKSDVQGLSYLAIHWGLLLTMGWLIAERTLGPWVVCYTRCSLSARPFMAAVNKRSSTAYSGSSRRL